MVSEAVTAIGKVYPCESLYDLIFSNPSLGSVPTATTATSPNSLVNSCSVRNSARQWGHQVEKK